MNFPLLPYFTSWRLSSVYIAFICRSGILLILWIIAKLFACFHCLILKLNILDIRKNAVIAVIPVTVMAMTAYPLKVYMQPPSLCAVNTPGLYNEVTIL